MTDPTRAYRPDLDGLRALAVLPVVLCHAGVRWLSGGFVGVDIFFVLSGFFITRIIHSEMLEQRFTLTGFYLRRARRILPALFLVLGASLILGLLLLVPAELDDFARTAAAALGSVSNILFWLRDGYFAPGAELQPLLMTWSLGVEEQFYLFYPLLLLIVLRLRWSARHVVLVISLLSLALACWAVFYKPKAAFYLLPTRIWELGLGAWLALASPQWLARRFHHIAGVIGILLIGWSLVAISASTPFPGYNALAPCIGTALLISARHGWVNTRVMSIKPLVYVGLISYSLYLWHWPLLSFARITGGTDLDLSATLPLAALSVLLASLTFRYVETPFRRSPARGAKPLLRYGGATLAGLALCAVVIAGDGFAWRMPATAAQWTAQSHRQHLPAEFGAMRWMEQLLHPLPAHCTQLPSFPARALATDCVDPARTHPRTALLWGDSHAWHMYPGLSKYLDDQGYGAFMASRGLCSPAVALLDLSRDAEQRACTEFSRQVLDLIRQRADLDPIIIVGRWGHYVAPLASQGVDAAVAMRGVLEEMARLNRTVVLMHQVPRLPFLPADCKLREHMTRGLSRACVASAEYLASTQAQSRAVIEAAATGAPGRVCVFDPLPALCGRDAQGWQQCSSELADGSPAYWDENHLSVAAAQGLAPHFEFARCLRQPDGAVSEAIR